MVIPNSHHNFDHYQIVVMDASGTELLNTLLQQLLCGTKTDVEQLAILELDFITECIDQLENKHLENLAKLECKSQSTSDNDKSASTQCLTRLGEDIRKEETRSKLKAYNIRDSFLKQILEFSEEVGKLYEKKEECTEDAIIILSQCLNGSADLDPLILCIESTQNITDKQRNSAKVILKTIVTPVYRSCTKIIKKAHNEVLNFSLKNRKILLKLTTVFNQCSKTQPS